MESQTKITAPPIIHRLVETFEQNLDSYRSTKNETELRREFLDKFFTALGWDVANEKGYDEAHKEVVHEFSVEVAGGGKKADYAFRTGTNFDFLVEAKKPSVKIESSQDAAFQIRRYGWSAKLPINILTDFEHFAVYDCRAKPNYSDKAPVGRIMLVHYKEYVERWDEIASVFSPDAVRKGSFAKYADGLKGKKRTADVDDAFLQEIERWRELLARNIALRNEEIDIAGLNYAVQMTIDRIIFLRICEERGIEPENQLLDIATHPLRPSDTSPKSDEPQSDLGEGRVGVVYEELCELFKRADTKYNSGLFHFKKEKGMVSRPDDLTLTLKIDDKVLKDIISNLYYPKSPYAFLYIPSDILGQVYERFLGKVIRLTAGHQAKVEEKPEVRKAGGVYYTPTYIVDYIVKNTVGKLVDPSPNPSPDGRTQSGEGRMTPKEVAKLKIVDPACGSGTFLLGAYQFLLDWHLNWYLNDDVEKWEKQRAIWKVESGYRLTTSKKKEILLNNIHGVDIDAQAVEVTKLSLLLKVLENASGQLGLGMERVLPDLGNNIKCGNSLIGFDYFEGQLLPDEEERARVNPFDWKNEFPQVFTPSAFGTSPKSADGKTLKSKRSADLGEAGRGSGGFDVVIGNPPYVLGRETFDENAKRYLASNYESYGGKYDLYIYFTEKAISLMRAKGKLGYIIPNTVLVNENAVKLRKVILDQTQIDLIRVFNERVFEDAQVESTILVVEKKPTNLKLTTIQNGETVSEISQDVFAKNQGFRFNVRLNSTNDELLGQIEARSTSLGILSDICIGIQLGGSSGNDTKESFLSNKKLDNNYQRVLDGKDINSYATNWNEKFVRYGNWLHRKRDKKYFLNPKIMIRQIGAVPVATFDDQNFYTLNTIYNLISISEYSPKFFLGVINSKFGKWFWRLKNSDFKSLFPKIKKTQIESIPICLINFSNPTEKAQHDKMVSLVEQMLALHKSFAAAKSPQEKERLARQIEVTDRAIDALVYELYGLSEEEIRIVEEK